MEFYQKHRSDTGFLAGGLTNSYSSLAKLSYNLLRVTSTKLFIASSYSVAEKLTDNNITFTHFCFAEGVTIKYVEIKQR